MVEIDNNNMIDEPICVFQINVKTIEDDELSNDLCTHPQSFLLVYTHSFLFFYLRIKGQYRLAP